MSGSDKQTYYKMGTSPRVPDTAEDFARTLTAFGACHGDTARGDGIVGELFRGYGVTAPPAFGSQRVRSLSPGEAYWSMTNGFGFMPAFGGLLTPEERWTLVHLVDLHDDEREVLLRSGAGQ